MIKANTDHVQQFPEPPATELGIRPDEIPAPQCPATAEFVTEVLRLYARTQVLETSGKFRLAAASDDCN